MLGILKLVILETCLFGFVESANSQDKAAAPVGSWRGSVVTFDLGSDGRFSYKDAETAKLTGGWKWLPTTLIGGVLELASSAPGSPKTLRFPITWMNKNTLRFCDANDHCDTLSRQGAPSRADLDPDHRPSGRARADSMLSGSDGRVARLACCPSWRLLAG